MAKKPVQEESKTPQQIRQEFMAQRNMQREQLDKLSLEGSAVSPPEETKPATAKPIAKHEELRQLAYEKPAPSTDPDVMPLKSVRLINAYSYSGTGTDTHLECHTLQSKFKSIEYNLKTNLIKVISRTGNQFYIPITNVANFSDSLPVTSAGVRIHGVKQGE